MTGAHSHPVPGEPHPAYASRVIDALGGPAKVSRAIERRTGIVLTQGAIVNWRRRGIPWRWRVPLALEMRQRKIKPPENFLGQYAPDKPSEEEVPFL